MKTSMRWLLGGIFTVMSALGVGQGVAHAAAITATDGTTVSVSLFTPDGAGGYTDISDTFVPEPDKTIYIVVNGSTNVPSLVAPSTTPISSSNLNPFLAELTTSKYPGQCTNFAGPDPGGADYTLGTATVPIGTETGYPLVSHDCGGMAVVLVGTSKIILPRDDNRNAIADSWEKLYGGELTNTADIDTGPGTLIGDGLSNFDEYRGFIVDDDAANPGKHIRTDPRQKDAFVHLVNPQCTATGLSLLGRRAGETHSIYPSDGSSLFANLVALITGQQEHLLGFRPGEAHVTTNQWVDRFESYSDATGFIYLDAAGTQTASPPRDDRQINAHAVYPIRDAITGLTIQKGLRITECLDTNVTEPLGSAGWGSPNGPDNALIYTERIVKEVDKLIGSSTKVTYSTFVSGAWTTPVDITRNNLISKVIEFYLAMEIGHSVRLTPTVETAGKKNYGYHHAPGSGSNLDQAIVNKISRTTGNTFSIPSLYNSADQSNFRLKD